MTARRYGKTARYGRFFPRLRVPEAVFIWNCFEQVADASSTLRAAYRVLDRDGPLIIRVPNFAFYHQEHRLMELQGPVAALRNLGYNNLLGFSYLYCYTPSTLVRLLRAKGFEPLAFRNSGLLTPPYPDLSAHIGEEWKRPNATRKLLLAFKVPGWKW